LAQEYALTTFELWNHRIT